MLISKSLIKVFRSIKDFEYQVKQQYRLSIYKIKYNNEKAMITMNNVLEYKLQAVKERIKIKLSLTYTYKPNKGSK